jgi:hypothetical protein
MCRPRLELEAGMKPWYISDEGQILDNYLSLFQGVIMKGETVFAFLSTVPKKHNRECVFCGTRTKGRDPDLRFSVVFQPRGLMSPSYPHDPAIRVKAWDVAFSPDIYPCFSGEGEDAAGETKRFKELLREYADYFPEHHVADLMVTILAAMNGFHPKKRDVPPQVVLARYKWAELDRSNSPR